MNITRGRDVGLPLTNLLRLKSLPIRQQLHLEERLLRSSSENWCIINDGTNSSNIVMGVSGKPSELIEVESVIRDRIPIMKRFTVGGTVIVDGGTVFISFICNKNYIPRLQPYPRPIMSWTGELYGEVLQGVGDFHLRENDYAFGNRKFGGNAQSITKDRWIHHTSFLWDYVVKNMAYLKQPIKAPEYRLARHHDDFLCALKEYLSTRSTFIEKTIAAIGSHFIVRPVQLEAVKHPDTTFHQNTRLVTEQELREAFASQIDISKAQI